MVVVLMVKPSIGVAQAEYRSTVTEDLDCPV